MNTILFAFQSSFATDGFATSGNLDYLCAIFDVDGEHTLENLKKAVAHDSMEHFVGELPEAKTFVRDRRGSKDISFLAKEIAMQNEIITPNQRVTWHCPDTKEQHQGTTTSCEEDGCQVNFDDGEEGYCRYHELDPA